MDSPEQWRWLWLVAAGFFAVAEMLTPVSFFMAPFALGSFVAAILAFAGVSVPIEFVVFLVVSIATLIALRPLSRRLDRTVIDHRVGSRRLLGRSATVLSAIPAGDEVGMVRVDREEWRAQSVDGAPIPAGAQVKVADVVGTRVIVTVTAPPPEVDDGDGAAAEPEPDPDTADPPPTDSAR
ncbi:MAG TPA: NfeD family protein [Acidimicrobiales bacterium]|nr:NfeD family protein [Acidimicrobiales bacterium]